MEVESIIMISDEYANTDIIACSRLAIICALFSFFCNVEKKDQFMAYDCRIILNPTVVILRHVKFFVASKRKWHCTSNYGALSSFLGFH